MGTAIVPAEGVLQLELLAYQVFQCPEESIFARHQINDVFLIAS